jgi:hypothetical protein
MITELSQHWALLRVLLFFAFVLPPLVLAVLVGLFRRRGQPRSSERKAHDVPLAPSAIAASRPEAKLERRVEAGPREWRVGGSAPVRRAA